jgi:hypothetical protein
MYSAVSGAQGKPFYGYSAGGGQDAYHDYDGGTHQWLLWMGSTRLSLRGSDGFMQIYGNAGKPGGGSWSTTSDARLKRDVQDLDDSLERLLALRDVSFESKDPEAVHELHGVQVGMIAQEVEQVFPDWVDEGEDGYKRLTFRGFEAVTVEALRELRAEKDTELAELRAENAARASRGSRRRCWASRRRPRARRSVHSRPWPSSDSRRCRAASAGRSSWTGSSSTSSAASASAWWAATAPASRPSCASCPAASSPTRAR